MSILFFDNPVLTKLPKIKYYVFLYRYPNIPTRDNVQLNYVLRISTPLQEYPIRNRRPLELRSTELRKCHDSFKQAFHYRLQVHSAKQ